MIKNKRKLAFLTMLICFFIAGVAQGDTVEYSNCDNACNGEDWTSVDSWCENNGCDEGTWDHWGTVPENCTMTMSNRSGTPGSYSYASGSLKEGIRSLCLTAPDAGSGSASVSETSTVTETCTSSFSWGASITAKAKVNVWLVGETEIGVTAGFESGSSTSSSKGQSFTESCTQTVNECNKIVTIRTCFERDHGVTGTGTFSINFDCWQSGSKCAGPHAMFWNDGNPCTESLSLTGTNEAKSTSKCESCSICCTSSHDDCCLNDCTSEEAQQDLEDCRTAAQTYP